MSTWQDLTLKSKQRWLALQDGERRALSLLGALIGLALAWLILVQPALRTLREAPAQLDAVDAQLREMQALAAEARELRALPPVPVAQAAQALQAASEHLGAAAKLSINGERAVLTLTGISSEALQAWLGEARSAARARPVQAQLARGPKGFTGSIVLALGGSAP
ncbi:type II secretion system protein GspM [Pelomonas sp. KK5]|uniref:type II secretion system protein GspM n=1 Tax=Pelomonas sp. KK5 TaxID=1855730 RepID=UPI00097BE7B7|nr:type II secretion system protein GspM [Pelomonas sp. KK5]